MADSTDRLSAALAGRYRIERELGAGGMATVYLAEDLKHDRKVAIKVLKPELAAVLGADRFVVEIKTTAALQHPHILPLFDSGTADSFLFYVMPYIEGETIREKLNRETQFGVDDAVRIAREVADALDYAHRHGVIHRDIKPENILLHDGRAMVMDFGIALAVSAAAGGRMTETGLSLGTPHYMSPEQATAEKEITPRSDVYSLASVLYEMLAGQPPHLGGPAQQVIMRIITEPARPVNEFRKNVPPNVAAALAKALEKLPADRFESAKGFADALGNAGYATTGGARGAAATSPAARLRFRLIATGLVVAGAIVGAAVAVPVVARKVASSSPSKPVRFVLSTAASNRIQASDFITLSRDGRDLVFAGTVDGVTALYHRTLDALEVRQLPGTEGGLTPTIAPDGWVYFATQEGNVKRVRIDGGPARRYAKLTRPPVGLSWSNREGLILGMLAGFRPNGLSLLKEGDSTVQRITAPPADKAAFVMHHYPVALDDGEHVLFIEYPPKQDESLKLSIASIKDSTWKQLGLPGGQRLVVGVVGDLLLYLTDDGRLMAVAWDGRNGRTVGEPLSVPDVPESIGSATVAADGTLAMVVTAQQYEPVIVDEHGRADPLFAGLHETLDDFVPRFSPDGRRVALAGNPRGSRDIWVWDRPTGPLAPLGFGQRMVALHWLTDGKIIGAAGGVRGSPDTASTLLVRSADASDSISRFYHFTGGAINAVDMTKDRKTMVVAVRTAAVGNGNFESLRLVHLGPTTTEEPFAAAQGIQSAPRFSPDDRWIAYGSIESDRFEVYVRSVQGGGARVQISDRGGSQPVWSPDGKRLYYRQGSAMMAADVVIDGARGTISVGRRERLFNGDFLGNEFSYAANYDVAPDGHHFLMARAVGQGAGDIVVMTGWLDKFKSQMAARKK